MEIPEPFLTIIKVLLSGLIAGLSMRLLHFINDY